jgi:hypothetical protein
MIVGIDVAKDRLDVQGQRHPERQKARATRLTDTTVAQGEVILSKRNML